MDCMGNLWKWGQIVHNTTGMEVELQELCRDGTVVVPVHAGTGYK